MEELKPCPFCGGKAVFAILDREKYRFVAGCPSCGIWTRGSAFKNDDYARKQWNKRKMKWTH